LEVLAFYERMGDMKWFLVVLFFKATGAPVLQDGWYPLEMDSKQQCIRGAYNITRQLNLIEASENRVFCKEATEESLYEYLYSMRGTPA
jgi:hypothetical protein